MTIETDPVLKKQAEIIQTRFTKDQREQIVDWVLKYGAKMRSVVEKDSGEKAEILLTRIEED